MYASYYRWDQWARTSGRPCGSQSPLPAPRFPLHPSGNPIKSRNKIQLWKICVQLNEANTSQLEKSTEELSMYPLWS